MTMIWRWKFLPVLLPLLVFAGAQSAWGQLFIHPKTAVNIELKGYNGLAVSPLFRGDLFAGENHVIDTPYRGLALLVFSSGQQYPVIIGDETTNLTITTPALPPSFPGDDENAFFYRLLAGEAPDTRGENLALLMWQAKQLLESSSFIHTLEGLQNKKEAFQVFVSRNYSKLQHSDMLRRMIGRYFMMHEYVSYHRKGTPAGEIRIRYQQEVLAGIGSWLSTLQDHIPAKELLNSCAALSCDRDMVSLSARIIREFEEIAYCSGDEPGSFSFPDDLQLARSDGASAGKLGGFKGTKMVAFVSDECPVSMALTVIKARELTGSEKEQLLIVAPLERLSKKHLAMNRNVSGGNMMFIDDEKWRKKNLRENLRLPLFVRIEANNVVR